MWTDKQRQQWKEKKSENLKKKQLMKDYIDVLLKKCKDHGGPITDIKKLNKLAYILQRID